MRDLNLFEVFFPETLVQLGEMSWFIYDQLAKSAMNISSLMLSLQMCITDMRVLLHISETNQ